MKKLRDERPVQKRADLSNAAEDPMHTTRSMPAVRFGDNESTTNNDPVHEVVDSWIEKKGENQYVRIKFKYNFSGTYTFRMFDNEGKQLGLQQKILPGYHESKSGQAKGAKKGDVGEVTLNFKIPATQVGKHISTSFSFKGMTDFTKSFDVPN